MDGLSQGGGGGVDQWKGGSIGMGGGKQEQNGLPGQKALHMEEKAPPPIRRKR